jgi:tRNA nucleotidyltransferase (CCA-adding enzyme)
VALKDVPLEALVFYLMEFDTPKQTNLLVTYLTQHRDLNPAVTGGDLKILGLRPGPQFGSILARVREALIVGEISADKEAQIQFVKNLISAGAATVVSKK